jgi:DNA polymerase-3 subunit delta
VPLHILYGYETFARDEALADIKASLDKDGALATNTAVFTASQSSPPEVIAACNTVPFLGEHRLVVLEGALATAGAKPRGKKAATEDGDAAGPGPWVALADYLPEMPPSTTLVLLDGDALESNALLSALKPLAETCRKFSAPIQKELSGWIAERARRIGLKIDAPAAKLLAELVGADHQNAQFKPVTHIPQLAMEMDKLAAYANGEVVRVDDVRQLVGRANEHKGYELSDAVADYQPARAIKVLAELLEDGANENQLLATLATRHRQMAITRDLMNRGASRAEIASELKRADNFGLTKLMEQVERLSPEDIARMYDRLVEVELLGKSTDRSVRLELEVAVAELATRPARSARR